MEPNQSTNDLRPMQPLGAATSPHEDAAYGANVVELRTALEDVVESVEVLLHRANGFLGRYAEEQPHVLLASAAGLGFVLGGGLASRTGSLLARAGGRLFLARWLQRFAQERLNETAGEPRKSNPAF